METKVYQAELGLKEGSEKTGEFEAVFATLGVVDHDGDVTVKGAFTEGQDVPVASYGHEHRLLPVGLGTVHERDGKAILNGQFFLDTEAGREHYLTLKHLGGLQQWSYAFDVEEQESGPFDGKQVRFLKKLKVHEVSPVLVGAGVDTQTTDIKSVQKAVTRSEVDGDHPASHYLVVEDPEKPTTWHLRVRDVNGKLDHGLMGAAWAALHGGYRGNRYQGPGKQEAIAKLTRLYAQEGMDVPKADWDGEEKAEGSTTGGVGADEGETSDQGKPSGARVLPEVLRTWVEITQIEVGG